MTQPKSVEEICELIERYQLMSSKDLAAMRARWNKAGRRRRLERYIQPRAGGTYRAPSRQWPRHRADGISAGGSGARPRKARRTRRSRALRIVRVRGRARQWLRRAHRPRRATPPARGRNDKEAAALRRSLRSSSSHVSRDDMVSHAGQGFDFGIAARRPQARSPRGSGTSRWPVSADLARHCSAH